MEKKVLRAMMNEHSANEIAIQLNLGIVEVDEIRKQIMRKAGVRSMVGLTKYVMQHADQILK